MIDVAWLGRESARNPICVKSARRIEHDAKWRRLTFLGTVAALAVGFVVVVALAFVL